jgi:hypothetical protein
MERKRSNGYMEHLLNVYNVWDVMIGHRIDESPR